MENWFVVRGSMVFERVVVWWSGGFRTRPRYLIVCLWRRLLASPLLILTLCGPERVWVVSTEPLDDLSCLTTPRSAVPETGCCPCR